MDSPSAARVTARRKGALRYFTFNAFDRMGGVTHAFSTRLGGISEAPFDSLNLGSTTEDDPACVAVNRQRWAEATDLALTERVDLVHGSEVLAVGPSTPPALAQADALVTDQPGVSLAICYADCVPVFLYDPQAGVVGLAHAGWRGTAAGVAVRTLQVMADRYGSRPDRVVAALGPGIGPCCFEVQEDVRCQLLATDPEWQDFIRPAANSSHWFVDLWAANARQLARGGMREDHVTVSGLCTACRPDLFFSYRRDRRRTGRLAAAVMLTGGGR